MKTCIRQVLADQTTRLVTLPPQATVSLAVDMMSVRHTGVVVVTQDGEVTGIFTSRDLAIRILAVDLNPAEVRVGDVMTRDPLTIHGSWPLEDAFMLMSECQLQHLPIVEDDKLLGVVSLHEVSTWLRNTFAEEVEDLRTYITGDYPALQMA